MLKEGTPGHIVWGKGRETERGAAAWGVSWCWGFSRALSTTTSAGNQQEGGEPRTRTISLIKRPLVPATVSRGRLVLLALWKSPGSKLFYHSIQGLAPAGVGHTDVEGPPVAVK